MGSGYDQEDSIWPVHGFSPAKEFNSEGHLNLVRLEVSEDAVIIKEYLNRINPDLVMLQETKEEEMDNRRIRSLWKARFRNWVVLPSIGRAGGIIIMWDRRKTEVIDSLVGEFSVSIKIKGTRVSGGCQGFMDQILIIEEWSFGMSWQG